MVGGVRCDAGEAPGGVWYIERERRDAEEVEGEGKEVGVEREPVEQGDT